MENVQNMIDLQKIFHHEIYFCESFTHTERTEYGVIFYNTHNPRSHDSNHTHILSYDYALDDSIQDIIQFYRSRQITPRIRASFIEHELDVLQPHLTAHGFVISNSENIFMQYSPASAPCIETSDGACRRISHLSQDIIDLIHTEEDGDWTIHVLERHLQNERFHLLGLYLDNTCRAIASVKVMQTYSRVDDVKTHSAFREQHLGTRLIKFLQAYHASISKNTIYLWAENPIAIKLYKNAGFQEFSIGGRPCWSAWIPEHAKKT